MSIITQREDEFIDNLTLLDDALLQYQYILAFASEGEELAPDDRNDHTRLRGCSSQAWMSLGTTHDGCVHMKMASDALIVRSIMGIISVLIQDASCPDVAAWIPRFIDADGIREQLSANRRSGVSAMLASVQSFARRASSP